MEGDGDAFVTEFALPEEERITGWSFSGREEGKAVSFDSGDEVILAAMAFDEGNGIRSADCDRLTQKPELLETADSMIAVRACFGEWADSGEVGYSGLYDGAVLR